MGCPLDGQPPWFFWLLVCLCRQRLRQEWLVEVARSLPGGLVSGAVPSHPEWSFQYHGRGLCLSGPDEETVDYDFHDSRGASIDPYFFTYRMVRWKRKGGPERQLFAWLGGTELIVSGLDGLRSQRWIVPLGSDRHVFTLSAALDADWRWLAAAAVEELEPLCAPPDRRDYRLYLLDLLEDRGRAARVVKELVPLLPPEDRLEICENLLKEPLDSASAATLDALHELKGPPSPAVLPLLRRLDPQEHHPNLARAAVRYLCSRGVAREEALEVLFAFAQVKVVKGFHGNPMLDELALLALEFAPQRALPVVQQALRSNIPGVVGPLSALLALLNCPWSLRELDLARLDDLVDDSCRRYLEGALGVDVPPPTRDPAAVGCTFEEVLAHNLPEWMAHHLQRMRPYAERLAAPD